VDEEVHAEAEARGLPLNVADVPALCNFILPAVVRRQPLAVAISTAGASPALAQRMKREAAERFGPAYPELARILFGLREWSKATLPTYDVRRGFFDDIVNGTPDPIALLERGDVSALEALIEQAKQRALAATGS
jgi:siroheme synthase-like protein